MLKSIESLQNQVSGPLVDCYGPKAKILTVEAHDAEVRGLAFCPGKIVRYIYHVQNKKLITSDMLSIKKKLSRSMD